VNFVANGERLPSNSSPVVDALAKIGAVALLGPPGSGKSTQARALSGIGGIPQISVDELFQINVNSGTFLGRVAKQIVNRGDPAPDSVIEQMVEVRLFEADTARATFWTGPDRRSIRQFG